jgi:hypothetical protein
MDYGVMDYGDMNWLAIVCAGLAYWLLAQYGIRRYLVRHGGPPSSNTALN